MLTHLEERIETRLETARSSLETSRKAGCIRLGDKCRFLRDAKLLIGDINDRLSQLLESQTTRRKPKTDRRMWLLERLKDTRDLLDRLHELRVFGSVMPLAEPVCTDEPQLSEAPKLLELPERYEAWMPLIEQGRFDKEAEKTPSERRVDYWCWEPMGPEELQRKRWALQEMLYRIEKKIERLEVEGDKKQELPRLLRTQGVVAREIHRTRMRAKRVPSLEVGKDNGYNDQWVGFVPPGNLLALSQWGGHIIDGARRNECLEIPTFNRILQEGKVKKDK